ncbi:biopolymer transporter ExbD [Wenzhouxiangella sp. XN24]|uniref:ExbD/TolR family protein n=1 Tax=Wenzhouxiangella sp. XN24 TaxID=2713569 RepID=UPI0013EA70B0|nr:biopolymer transporter ExbD [Wenzhouxiangella sp. XN24]NGX16049.1 biopolymer transporter ExbD [Wenzhouxiangella sp. XN24]
MQPPSRLATPRFAAGAGRRRAVISLTPLVDVVFILLVFFMLASSFLDWRYVTMDTPAARAAAPPSDVPALVLVVSRDGILLEDTAVSAAEAIAAADRHLAQHPDVAVRLQPAGDTPLQAVMDVLDALSAAGLEPLKLVRDPAWQDDREAMD